MELLLALEAELGAFTEQLQEVLVLFEGEEYVVSYFVERKGGPSFLPLAVFQTMQASSIPKA